ncbi:epimerase [Labrys sp. WJW]|uniref:sugar phosphate isomerase/epimerase family protein n=1 Tax=Labrys sp. WJW TaxID=1737983 RepID=UPI0008302B1F|nr:sugar phosphate isomerase/epimerase [Labrys sp. WJW]OCC02531.1 epimerase [Labrys sp. WJW]
MDKLGIHSFVWTGGTTQQDLEGAMEKSHRLGYKLIEFPRLDPRKFDVSWLARRLKDYDLAVTVTMGLPLEGDISSEDAAVVRRGEEILADAVAITRDLGGHKLGGIIFSAHTKYRSLPTRKGWDNSVATLSRLADKAKQAGVSLNLEIVNRFETNLLNTTAQGLAFIQDTGSDNIFLHLDTFHMNIEEADPVQAIRLAGDKLGYFHIGESNRGYLGSGVINFPAIFDALVASGYDDWITFESFSSEVVDEDLSIICAIWRNTWTDNVELAQRAKAFIDDRYAEAQRKAETARTP